MNGAIPTNLNGTIRFMGSQLISLFSDLQLAIAFLDL